MSLRSVHGTSTLSLIITHALISSNFDPLQFSIPLLPANETYSVLHRELDDDTVLCSGQNVSASFVPCHFLWDDLTNDLLQPESSVSALRFFIQCLSALCSLARFVFPRGIVVHNGLLCHCSVRRWSNYLLQASTKPMSFNH